MNVIMDDQHIALMQLVEKLIRTKIKDIIPDGEEKYIIIVDKGLLNKALGKQASNLRLLEKKLNKKVRIAEFNEDASTFLKNLCKPNKVVSVEEADGIYTIIPQDFKSRGFMIGKNASTLRLHEQVMQRYFDVKELKVAEVQE